MTAATVAPRRRNRSLRSHRTVGRGPGRWFVLLGVVVCAVLVAAPFLLLLLNAFKTQNGYLRSGPLAWPTSFSAAAFGQYIADVDYPVVLLNSVIISAVVAVAGVVISLLAAYAIGIGRVRGRTAITGILLFATILPQEALLYPLYYGAQALGLRNTIWSVVIIFSVLQGAYGTYLLSSQLGDFPKEVLEAAALDGAGRRQILSSIVYPMMRPTLSVLLVFFFIWTWNEYFIPFIMLTDPSVQTIPIALATLKGQNSTNIVEQNAGSLLSLLPTLVFFLVFQRTLTRGVAAGAVK